MKLAEKIKTLFRRALYYLKHAFSHEHLIFFAGAVACFFFTWSAVNAISRNWELELRLAERKNELTVLRLEVENLGLENAYYASEEYQELSARAKYNKAADGEKLVYLPANSDIAKNKHQQVAIEEPKEEPSNIRQWLSFLFGV